MFYRESNNRNRHVSVPVILAGAAGVRVYISTSQVTTMRYICVKTESRQNWKQN